MIIHFTHDYHINHSIYTDKIAILYRNLYKIQHIHTYHISHIIYKQQ